MGSRLELHTLLENVLGSTNVYFQPPESMRMQYDAIRYELSGKDIKRANDKAYRKTNRYDGVIITRDPDTTLPDKLIDSFEMCSFGTPYTAENLNHYPFTIYF